MLNNKQKQCAGVEGISSPHFAFIYKNIGGKKYCRDCAYKLQPPKAIPKRSERGRERIKEKIEATEEQFHLFIEIWEERKREDGRNYCEVTGKQLPSEPLSTYFDHLLEKAIYPEYRFDKRNIAIVDTDVHSLKTGGFPLPKHIELIENFKKLIQC